MPVFYFEIADAKPNIPCVGENLPSLAAARCFALKYAALLLCDQEYVFWEGEEWVMTVTDANRLPEPLTVLSITNGLIDAFIAWRSAQGASAPTISRDIAALRGPINWGMKNNHLTAAPRIKEVKGRKKRKELEWSPEQVAAILDAAAADEQRRHIHLFAMINLSTHGRTEAILELDADTQIRQGLIYFLRPDEEQTRKRRAIVPICPTLAPWLDGVTGKVIRYRTPTSAKTRAAGGPEWFERPTANIANGFEGVLLAAHAARPDLGLARQAVDADGKPVWLEPRKKLGETKRRPKMVSIGSPNTLRHTIHTWHKRHGVPEAQIDAAAGHSEQGTGASYTHLRPEYLREFMSSTEAFWEAVGGFTDAHLRYQRCCADRSAGKAHCIIPNDYRMFRVVEPRGIEPLASAVRLQRSPI